MTQDIFLTRRTFLVGAGLGAAGLLAGCGGSGGGSSPGNGSPPGGYAPDANQFTPNYVPSIGLDHWAALPVRVFFANDLSVTPPGGSLTRVNDLIQVGFSRWGAATGGVAGYTVTTDPAQAQITVTTVPIPDPSGRAETGKATDTTAAGGILTSAGVQMYVWPDITVPELTQGFLATAAHEFGHALGIAGHSPNPTDVMYALHDPNADVALTVRDINTIKTIYYFLF